MLSEDCVNHESALLCEDWIRIDILLYAGFFFSVIKALVSIITISYFFAMIFKVIIDFQQDIMRIDWKSLDTTEKRKEWFVSQHLLEYSVLEEGELEG